MDFGVFDILTLLGALGFFIYGMKIMSEGIQKVAGSKLRQILGAMTRNRFFGVFTGFLITGLIQSSSATTVMTVSFVNAGLLTLTESAGVMMGANIGTTVTAWFLSILGFKVKISAASLPIIAVGLPLLFSKRGNLKSWGETLIGFALLFMGLEELKHAVPDLKSNPQVLEFLSGYTDLGILSRLMFVGIGAILTILIQSSSAAMALTLVMCNNGWIPVETAAAMVLGENIGTTITAELASLVANVHAKRSARIHTMFNVIGVTWMVIILPFFIQGIDRFMVATGLTSPFEDATAIPIALSYFHTAFNATNVLLLIGFVPWLVRFAIRLVPSRGDLDEEFRLDHIGNSVTQTPEISIVQAKRELAKFGKITSKMSGFVQEMLLEKDTKARNKMAKKVKKYEQITDRVEIEVVDYLSKVMKGELSESSSTRAQKMISITTDLERIGDIFFQMSKTIDRKNEEKLWFTPEQRQRLIEIFKLIDEAFEIMILNLNEEYENVSADAAKTAEKLINKKRNELRREHFNAIEKGAYNIKSGLVYNDLFSACEKVGDHIINVTEAVTGEIS